MSFFSGIASQLPFLLTTAAYQVGVQQHYVKTKIPSFVTANTFAESKRN